ncbi:MAG: hypothetical protein DI616_01950 [Paracoccus denitrificans]|uniref:Autotransporter domain-containing protein n=1 Tax=Paracoccus denitrificans TaxID=266 RepID=A0A533IGU5_PARDE|nr:MAG: hypothetical protein DI616_01950 [Paracoccus denitrificans]
MSRCLTSVHRSPRSALLLRSTALLTLIPLLASVQPAFADLIIDNANAPTSTGTTSAVTGDWSTGSLIWWDDQTNQYVALGAGETGVLTNPDGAVTLTLDGTIDVGGITVNDDGFTLTGGTLKNASGRLVFSTANAGTRLDVSSALQGGVSVEDGVNVVYDGISDVAGLVDVDSASQLTNDGSITGTVDNDGTFTVGAQGILTGDAENSGTMVNDGTITGTVDNDGTFTVGAQGTLTGDANNSGTMVNDGTITGTVDNDGTFTVGAQGTLTGDADNSGTMVVDGDTTGTGTVTGTITNSGTLELRDSDIGGDIVNNDGATTYVNTTAGSVIAGDVQNDGDILGANSSSTLTITGRLTNDGNLDVATFGDKLEINATEILLTANSAIDNDVSLYGTEVNQGIMTLDDNNQSLAGGYVNGGLLNEGSGEVYVEEDLDGSGFDITNENKFEIQSGWGWSTTSVTNVSKFNNSGASASLVIEDSAELEVNTLENSGTITNSGTLTGLDTAAAPIRNLASGTITSDGTINGDIVNNAGATLTNSGQIIGDVQNDAGGTLSSSNLIDGAVVNAGNAILSDTITGKLTNTNNTTGAAAQIDLGGDLNVGELENNGNLSIGQGETLTVDNSAAVSTGSLDVDGTLSSDLSNDGTLEITGEVTGLVTNTAIGRLTSTGTIGGLTNESSWSGNSVAGTINGDVINREDSTLASSATVNGSVFNDGDLDISGTVTGTLTNKVSATADTTLTLGGDLEVGGLVNNGEITVGSGLRLTSNSEIDNNDKLVVDGIVDAGVDNDGTLDIAGEVTGFVTNTASGRLTSTGTIGRLTNASNWSGNSVAGTINGNLINREDSTLASSATVNGSVFNNGDLDISGTVTGTLTNKVNATADTTLTLGGDLDVGGLVNNGEITVGRARKLTSNSEIDNNDKLVVNGIVDAAVDNDGAMTVAGEVTGVVTNTTNGKITSTGTIGGLINESDVVGNSVAGTVNGDVVNRLNKDLTSSATVNGDVINNGTMKISGKVAGTLTNKATSVADPTLTLGGNLEVGEVVNNGEFTVGSGFKLTSGNAIDNNDTLIVNGTVDAAVDNDGAMTVAGDITGKVTNNNGATLNSTGSLGGLENNNADATVSGRISGDVDNLNDGVLVSSAAIAGNVVNDGTATLSRSVGGAITNNGTLNITDTLRTGATVAAADPTVINEGTINLSGVLAGRVENDGTLNMSDAKLSGPLNNTDHMNLVGSSVIDGDVTSTGTITGRSVDTDLLIGDGTFFFSDGRINVSNGSKLTITADYIDIGQSARYDNANVTLIGGISNSGEINLEEADTLDGNLLNRLGGSVTISANVNAAGHDVTNHGDFLITTDSDSWGNLHHVDTLTNTGTFDIERGTRVSAARTVNKDGTLTVGGNLTTTLNNQAGATLSMDGGRVTGDVTNSGDMNGDGTVTERLTNRGTLDIASGDKLSVGSGVGNSGSINLAGELETNLNNTAAGEVLLNGGTIDGTLTNTGTISGTGTVTGRLTNAGRADLGGTLAGVANSGTLGTNGDLSVASLNNTGTVVIDEGDNLRSATAVVNRNQLNVAGTLTASLTNAKPGTTELQDGTITGDVTNNGLLTGSGRIESSLTNNGTATIAGSTGALTNSGTLSSTGDLQIDSLVNTGTTNVTSNTVVAVDGSLSNKGQLNVDGNLVGALSNAKGATTTLSGGTITGDVGNDGTLGGDGTIDGTLTNRGATTVAGGNTLNTDMTSNYGTLTVAGTLGGTLVNRTAGTTNLNGGTIDGPVGNLGTLKGDGTITGKLTNSNNATLGGTLAAVDNRGVLRASGKLSATDLTNSGTVAIGAADELTVSGVAINETDGTVRLGGKFIGDLTNSGTISGSGSVTGLLTTDGGRLNIDGSMTVGDLSNVGTLTLSAGDTLVSLDQAENSGRLNVLGTLDSDLLNNGTTSLNGGAVTGDITNGAGSTLFGTGTIGGDLTNNGLARLAGSIGDVVNNDRLETAGTLTVASLTNTGTVAVQAGENLRSASTVDNAGVFELGGTLTAGLDNAAGATTTLQGGTVTGDVLNEGTLTGNGTFGGNLTNRNANATIGGTIGIDLINLGGTITLADDMTVEGRILNSASQSLVVTQRSATVHAAATPGLISIADGTTTTAKGGTQNYTGATMQVDGTLISDVFNEGTFVNDGTLRGNVANIDSFTSTGRVEGSIVTGFSNGKYYDGASASLGGRVAGDVTFAAGSLDLADGLSIGGTLDLREDYALADGRRVNAAQTLVQTETTLSLGGTLGGNLVNGGTIKLTDNAAAVVGNLENVGTVDLRNNDASTVLTTQGLSGNGVIMMDVYTAEDLAGDKVVVSGGATTGHVHLSFAELQSVGGATVGKATTLLDVDDGYSNTFSYTADELAASSERIVYSVEQGSNGDIQLVSQVNPAIGAMFANVTLVQSLIGSVINRPTSPYVTGLVTDYGDKPCGIGGWGRATGGNATVQGKTDNQVSVLDNEVSADYYGMQGGVDLVCFDDRYAGWDLSFGVLGGVNIGDSTQPIYAVDSRDSQSATSRLASITTTDFQQVYGGVYMTGTKDRWTADLQIRGEKTDFELKNRAVEGSGLRIETPDFSSDGITISGSLAYSMPVKDTGWVVTPNVGFAWSKYSTESISFDGDFELEFDDSERQIGFAGASIGKTFIRESENAALHTFATATYFKDFADDAVSRLSNATLEGYETQILTSENLKNYGEVSIGANYVKVLNPGKSGRPRQFSTSARIDGRFGDSIDSVGVTGQFRLQF